jgi:hypothetical protein
MGVLQRGDWRLGKEVVNKRIQGRKGLRKWVDVKKRRRRKR